MIGKVMTGKAFGGCIRYLLEKEKATILDADGIRTENTKSIIYDFNMQRKLNPDLGKAVGHIALSWSLNDKEKLSPELMVERAKEYLEKMKIHGTQYLIVQHQDRQHPHIHIVYNRVNNEGKTISDQFQKQRNGKVCKELTLKHGYYLAGGKENVNRQQLKGADQVKYQLYDAIGKSVNQAKTWTLLETMLSKQGIQIIYKYKGGTQEIQGVSFRKDDVVFKGSQIDRSLSYGGINQQIAMNQQASISPITQQTKFEQDFYWEFHEPAPNDQSRSRMDDLLWALSHPPSTGQVGNLQYLPKKRKEFDEDGTPKWKKTYKRRRR
jgi:hypothetical protein